MLGSARHLMRVGYGAVALVAALAAAGCGGGGGAQGAGFAARLDGSWNGNWEIESTGSSGRAYMTVSADNNRGPFSMVINTLGDTFNGGTLSDAVFAGTAHRGLFTVTDSPPNVPSGVLTFNDTGPMQGRLTFDTGTIATVDLQGTWNAQSIVIAFTVNYRDGTTATGTITLTKQ